MTAANDHHSAPPPESQAERARIEAALANGEFVLYYQPKVDLRDGRVVGVEALIRWQHPQRGLLAPRYFLPAIEGGELAAALDRWVIETAVTQLADWQRAGLTLTANVNVSARLLYADSFAYDLTGALAAHPEVAGGALELEVKEADALADAALAARRVADCRQLGVRFALDGFGRGGTSLSHLRHLGVDTLKVDQSLVRAMLDEAGDLAMVEGVIGLGRAFRCQVVAEGVETAAHCAALVNLGCVFGQGYGIARPMPSDEVAAWCGRRAAPSA